MKQDLPIIFNECRKYVRVFYPLIAIINLIAAKIKERDNISAVLNMSASNSAPFPSLSRYENARIIRRRHREKENLSNLIFLWENPASPRRQMGFFATYVSA